MQQNIIKRLHSELNSYSRSEWMFIILIMLCNFFIVAEASVTRAVANSVFLSAYTAKFFPYAWFASVPLNFLIVAFYNHFLPSFGCRRMMLVSLSASGVFHVFCVWGLGSVPFLPFLLYIWKDLFIILMFQQTWPIIHATIHTERAKYLYGIIFGAGGLGAVFGNMIPGFLAVLVGSENLLLTTLPFYVITALTYCFSLHIRSKISSKQNISNLSEKSTDIMGGLKLIHASHVLKFILIIVLAIQVSSTILEYQFNIFLEKTFVIKDIRTEFLGRFFCMVGTINIFTQFILSYLLVHFLGLQLTHFLIPFTLVCNAFILIFFPSFQLMSYSLGLMKVFDHSIFGIIKEMLYIPLKVDEKFKAKAIIDVFVYRCSKALASSIILGLQFIPIMSLNMKLSTAVFVICSFWIISVLSMFKYYYLAMDKRHMHWPESKKSILTT